MAETLPDNSEPKASSDLGSELQNIKHKQEAVRERNQELLQDPSVVSVSFRRHGRYERGDNVPTQRGQLTKETMKEVREVAHEWVAALPEEVDLRIVTSPTYMPAEGPTGEKLEPKRASVTGALYGAELPERFGEGYGYLGTENLSKDETRQAREESGVEHNASREHDRRIGDIFEMTTAEQSQYIPAFFKQLSQEYGGLTPDFWKNYIQGTLPKELNYAYLAGGGEPAVVKAEKAVEVLQELAQKTGDQKQVDLVVSHEEVIGSLAFQIAEYVKEKGLADEATAGELEDVKFSYNQGFDVHVGENGHADIVLGGELFEIDLNDLQSYLKLKVAQQA